MGLGRRFDSAGRHLLVRADQTHVSEFLNFRSRVGSCLEASCIAAVQLSCAYNACMLLFVHSRCVFLATTVSLSFLRSRMS